MALGKSTSPARSKAAESIRRLEGLRKDATRPLAFRLSPEDYEALRDHAEAQGMKLSQLVKAWVLQRMKEEGIKRR
jgi:predicted HicB family RNase H-like nuclease